MRRIRTGDQVVVIRGEDRGKRGKVTRFNARDNLVVVEGINLVKRHLSATPQRPGGILEVEAPFDASKVMVVDPEGGEPTRVRYEQREGRKVRVAKSGAEIVGEKG
jgi:large subunit ribosomal protein L24